MKKNLILLLFAGLAFATTSCKESKATKDKDIPAKKGEETKPTTDKKAGTGELIIATPEGWTRKDTTMMGQQAIFLMSETEGPTDMFRQNINVLSEKTGAMAFDDYIKLSTSNLGKMLTGYVHRSEKDITVDGVAAKSIDYTHSMSGYDIDVNAVMLIKDRIAYIITSSDLKGKLERWRKIIDETVASFHVN
jgi:hypothetical protein